MPIFGVCLSCKGIILVILVGVGTYDLSQDDSLIFTSINHHRSLGH